MFNNQCSSERVVFYYTEIKTVFGNEVTQRATEKN